MALLVSARLRALLLLFVLSFFFNVTIADAESGPRQGPLVSPGNRNVGLVKLDYSNKATASTANQTLWMNNVDATEHIGEIIVEGDCHLANFTALEELVKSCREDLRNFHWELRCPIPRSMLKTLDSIPSLRLHYEIPFHQANKQDRQAIVASRSLYELKGHITYGGQSNFEDLRHVRDILASCPNLRVLDLALQHHGCVVSDNPWAFDFVRDNRPFPPLERLKLGGYELDNSKNGRGQTPNGFTLDMEGVVLWPWSYLPQWVLDYWWSRIYDWGGVNTTAHDLSIRHGRTKHHELSQQLEPYNLDAWLQVMDWSKLKMLALHTATPKILQRLSTVLHSCEHFVLASGEEMVASELPTFISNRTAPLRSLSLSNIMFDQFDDLVEAMISSANSTLTFLTLAEHEETRMHYCMSDWSEAHCAHKSFGTWYSPQPFLHPKHLQQLAEHVPNLTHLELGIARFRDTVESAKTNETHWSIDIDALDNAALIPSLTNLTIHIESPDHLIARVDDVPMHYGWEHRAYKDPTFNRSSVRALCRNLHFLRKDLGWKPLREFVIKVGQWDSLDSDWGMGGPPHLLAGKWVCQTDEDERVRFYGGNALVDGRWLYGSWRRGRDAGLQDPYSLDWSVDEESSQRNDFETDGMEYDEDIVIPWN